MFRAGHADALDAFSSARAGRHAAMHSASTVRHCRRSARRALAGLGAACSADATRVREPFFTGSTPNQQSIMLYPSICFFEGTALSLGRGTHMPFQVIGHPDLRDQPFSFTPVDIPGMSVDPPLEGKLCHGLDLRKVKVEMRVDLSYLINMYKAFPVKDKFFVEHFGRWAGSNVLAQQIRDGMTEEQIRDTWQDDLEMYKAMRAKYLLYD